MEGNEVNLGKFPHFIRDSFKKYNLQFPDDTLWSYSPLLAYRVIEWTDGRDSLVSIDDFKSQAEMGKIPKGKDPEKVKSQPIYYGVSLFSDYNQLKNLFKLPKPTKRLARGHVNQEGGPMRLTDETSHVTWWLYEGVEDFLKNDFVIQEQENKYEQRSHFMFYNKRT